MFAVSPTSLAEVELMFPSPELPADPPAGAAAWESLFSALRPLAQCACVYDLDGQCLFANKALGRWLGHDESELIGLDLVDLWPADFAAREEADCCLVAEAGRLERLETRPCAGGHREVRAVKYPWRPRGGRPLIVVVFEECPAMPGDRACLVGWMALGIAHDLNNSLMMVRSVVELQQAGLGDAGEQFTEMGRLLDHAAELPRQLLAFARDAAPSRQRVDVNALILSLQGLLRSRAGLVEFEFRLDMSGVWVKCDSVQVVQVLVNLSCNALQAMGGRGRLVFETRVEGGFAVISVQDNGPGIAPDALGRIFDPLYTTRRGGTGLGLAVVREVVRRHGGRVGCVSEPGQGARFVLEFPLENDREANAVQETALVVDPAEDISRLSGLILEQGGYRALCHTALDESGPPADAIVLCASLLDAEGLALLEGWLVRNPKARLVVTSTGPEPPLTAVCAARLHGIVNKPYNAEALLRAVAGGSA
jgi:PAS domain S-box-containing protein